MASRSVMTLVTMEEYRPLMPSKESRIGPVFPIKARSKLSFILTDHLLSPPCLFCIYNDISLSVYGNNTIYRYYSQAFGNYAFFGKIGICIRFSRKLLLKPDLARKRAFLVRVSEVRKKQTHSDY